MKNKFLKIAGGLFIFVAVIYVACVIVGLDYSKGRMFLNVFSSISFVCLAAYCFISNDKKSGKISYYTGFACLLTVLLFNMLLTGINNRYHSLDILYIVDCITYLFVLSFFIIAKIKPNKIIVIIGTVVLCSYSIFCSVYSVINITGWIRIYVDYGIGVSRCVLGILYNIATLVQIAAFILIWLNGYKEYQVKKLKRNENVKGSTETVSIESELVNLKQTFENGQMSAEEYADKRSEILSKL